MADFIDDEELEEDQEDSSYQKKERRHRRKRKKTANYRLDDEDREVIKENTGIELKPKSRLKRNAEKVDRQGEAKLRAELWNLFMNMDPYTDEVDRIGTPIY